MQAVSAAWRAPCPTNPDPGVRSTPPSRRSATVGRCWCCATWCSATAATSGCCRLNPKEGIASNILSDRLKRLVEGGLLTRDGAGPGQRATYSLTEPSIQLVPVFAQLGSWGLRHRPTTPELRVRAELLEAGGPELWTDFMNELRETHLGIPRPETGRDPAGQRLADAYSEAIGSNVV